MPSRVFGRALVVVAVRVAGDHIRDVARVEPGRPGDLRGFSFVVWEMAAPGAFGGDVLLP
jgi:hypothetical protein